MSLKFGLNVKPKAQPSAAAPSSRRAVVFDDDFDDDDDETSVRAKDVGEDISDFNGTTSSSRKPPIATTARPVSKSKAKAKTPTAPPTLKGKIQRDEFHDLSANRESEKHASTAAELDATIYDYDSFHDAQSAVTEAKKAATKQEAIERKPKYMNNLLDAASRRKQDQLVAREKLLQKEREAEGDEFADKEKFVTGAYKAQQEEARRIEAEEKQKTEEEEKRRKAAGGGMQGFYRGMMAENDKKHQEAMEAAQKVEAGGQPSASTEEKRKTDAQLAEEMKTKGVNVFINEEGQVADKRQLLTAGLNIASSGQGTDQRGADHLKSRPGTAHQAYQGRNRNDQRGMRERQTKMMEEQLAESAKRAADEEAEEQRQREHAAKSRKTEGDISSAKERYLARKREAEAAKKAAG